MIRGSVLCPRICGGDQVLRFVSLSVGGYRAGKCSSVLCFAIPSPGGNSFVIIEPLGGLNEENVHVDGRMEEYAWIIDEVR